MRLHFKKSFSIFPFPAGMSLTKISLGRNYDVIYKLFLPRESLVSDIPVGDGNIEKLFYVVYSIIYAVLFNHGIFVNPFLSFSGQI
jgi:hypothetical protein